MDDLISRAAAIEYLMTNMGWYDEDGYQVDDSDDKRAIITDLVNGIPAVDAVPVVRCKDCKYWEPCSDGESGICGNLGGLWESIDFCSDGERRDEGEAD